MTPLPRRRSPPKKRSSPLALVYVRLHIHSSRATAEVKGVHNQRVDEILDMRMGPYQLHSADNERVALKASDRLLAGVYHISAMRTPLKTLTHS